MFVWIDEKALLKNLDIIVSIKFYCDEDGSNQVLPNAISYDSRSVRLLLDVLIEDLSIGTAKPNSVFMWSLIKGLNP